MSTVKLTTTKCATFKKDLEKAGIVVKGDAWKHMKERLSVKANKLHAKIAKSRSPIKKSKKSKKSKKQKGGLQAQRYMDAGSMNGRVENPTWSTGDDSLARSGLTYSGGDGGFHLMADRYMDAGSMNGRVENPTWSTGDDSLARSGLTYSGGGEYKAYNIVSCDKQRQKVNKYMNKLMDKILKRLKKVKRERGEDKLDVKKYLVDVVFTKCD
jgi:hypothetical protein